MPPGSRLSQRLAAEGLGSLIAAWIGAAYWFTASTSFANPAITLGRSLTGTFAGIRPLDAPYFMAAQFAGALLGLITARSLFPLYSRSH